MSDSLTALVTGANGFIGSHLCQTLADRGYRVKALVRKTSNLRFLENIKCDLVYGDISQPDTLCEPLKNVQYVFHPAGLVRARSREIFFRVNQEGTRNLLQEVRRQTPKLKRFVHISSQAAAGPSQTLEPKTERDPSQPVSWYGQSKLASEQEVLEFRADLPITIIRPPAVYGPRDDDVLKFFKLVKFGINPRLGMSQQYVSLVQVGDLVQGIIASALNDKAIGEIFYAANPDIYSVNRVLAIIAEIMHTSYIDVAIPMPCASLLGLIVEKICALTNTIAPFSRDKLKELSQNYWICSALKAEKLLGWKAKVSLQDGLELTYNWYKKQGWL